MASGLPVVSTNYKKISEIVSNEVGILVKPGKIKDVASAIIKIYKDNKLRERLKTNSRKFVVKNFDWNKHAHFLENIFNEVLNEKN
jgi:glycosyltransferase involved in cell wall biosynthesis